MIGRCMHSASYCGGAPERHLPVPKESRNVPQLARVWLDAETEATEVLRGLVDAIVLTPDQGGLG